MASCFTNTACGSFLDGCSRHWCLRASGSVGTRNKPLPGPSFRSGSPSGRLSATGWQKNNAGLAIGHRTPSKYRQSNWFVLRCTRYHTFLHSLLFGRTCGSWVFDLFHIRLDGRSTDRTLWHQLDLLALIKQPTAKGRGVMDQIEGFRMYLGPVEGEMLEKINPPEKTPQLFEKLLPYALALGVENTWAEQFVEVLRAAATDPASSTYQPGVVRWQRVERSWHRLFCE